MKKKSIIILLTLFIITLFLFVFKTLRLLLFSFISSWLFPIDNQYIIDEAEWISDRGRIIRFDNGESTLVNDTIYYYNKPKFVIKNLNKFFNEIIVQDLKTNIKVNYISTREFTK